MPPQKISKILISILLFALNISSIIAQAPDLDPKKITISGYIKDVETGEDLIGANIFVKDKLTGTSTNAYGFYSITILQGEHTFIFSFIGYNDVEKILYLQKDTILNIELSPINQNINAVIITGEKRDVNISQTQMSFDRLEITKIRKLPTFVGEVDIIKSLHLLPGVKSISEGSAGFSVRGGGKDQNLILLDEATVYNSNHVLGFFSVFNNDAVKDVEIYKGNIPAKYGGRLSSVVDIKMKNDNAKRLSVRGGIGNLFSRLTIEAPIKKNKSSFIISGRRSYFDIFFPLAPKTASINLKDINLSFYDLNAKLNFALNHKNRLFVSSYFGQDLTKTEWQNWKYGNKTFTLRWNHLFNKKLFANTSLIYSDYKYQLTSPAEEIKTGYIWDSQIQNYQIKIDFTYFLNPSNTMEFGGTSSYKSLAPGEIIGSNEESLISDYKIPNNYFFEHAVYVSNEQLLRHSLKPDSGDKFTNAVCVIRFGKF